MAQTSEVRGTAQECLRFAGDQSQDCQEKGNFFANCAMYTTNCVNVTIGSRDRIVNFGCLSNEGQSGSPVWTYEPATNQRTLLGVGLSGGDIQTGAAPGTFVLITQEVYSELE